jgi:hypothetical protein
MPSRSAAPKTTIHSRTAWSRFAAIGAFLPTEPGNLAVTGTLMLVTGLVVWRISRRSMQELPEVVDQMRQLANRFEEDSRSSQAEVLGLELAYQRLDDVLNSIAEGRRRRGRARRDRSREPRRNRAPASRDTRPSRAFSLRRARGAARTRPRAARSLPREWRTPEAHRPRARFRSLRASGQPLASRRKQRGAVRAAPGRAERRRA